MQRLKNIYNDLKIHYNNFGLAKTFVVYLESTLNKFFYFDCWNIITVLCEKVKSPKGVDLSNLSYSFALYEDLLNMQKQQIWEIDETKLNHFLEGDKCLLSYVNNQLAGYTWIHIKGVPLLQPGLRIKIPDQYIYNYAAFTLSDFRGQKLQHYRHYILCKNIELKNNKYLLGYVKYTNWSSRYGQSKSGYYPIGKMWLIGTKSKYLVFSSKKIKQMGIKRIPA